MTGSYMTQVKFTLNGLKDGWNDIVVNLPTALTIQERKLHRSCLNYQINGGYVYDTNNDAIVKLGVAPDTWPVVASLKRGRNLWLDMHRTLFKNNPEMKPKWHDYKPMLTQGQANDSVPTYNVPEDIHDDNLPYNDQGITFSVYVTEDGQGNIGTTDGSATTDKDEFTVHLLGDHTGSNFGGAGQQYTSVGLLESWIMSRPDLDPVNTISSTEESRISNDPLNLLFNDGDADNEIIANFTDQTPGGQQEGDTYPSYHTLRPFGAPELAGNNPCGAYNIQEVSVARSTGQMPVSYFTGFKALLGQVYLRIKMNGPGDLDILFDVNPRGASI